MLGGQLSGGRIAGILCQRIDRGTACPPLGQHIGMQRNEQVRPGGMGHVDTARQRYELVFGPRQHHLGLSAAT